MHELTRGVAPACLAAYQHGRDQWSNVTPTNVEREAIRAALEAMQGRRCAYCECNLDQHGQHIEHFRQRARYPQGTFDWTNLFWSCSRGDSCGKHKDNCGVYNHTDLIKPDVEDPERFFLFVSDGSIALRPGLTPQEETRARETLRILNLDGDHGALRHMRKAHCAGYVTTGLELLAIAQELPPEEWLPFLEDELALTQHLPFSTAIKHTLMPF